MFVVEDLESGLTYERGSAAEVGELLGSLRTDGRSISGGFTAGDAIRCVVRSLSNGASSFRDDGFLMVDVRRR